MSTCYRQQHNLSLTRLRSVIKVKTRMAVEQVVCFGENGGASAAAPAAGHSTAVVSKYGGVALSPEGSYTGDRPCVLVPKKTCPLLWGSG